MQNRQQIRLGRIRPTNRMETVPRLRQPLMALADAATAATEEAAVPQALHAAEAALQEFDNRLADRETVARSL